MVTLSSPTDMVLRQEKNGKYQVLIKGTLQTNRLNLE